MAPNTPEKPKQSKLALKTQAIAKQAKILSSQNQRIDKVQRMTPAGRLVRTVAS